MYQFLFCKRTLRVGLVSSADGHGWRDHKDLQHSNEQAVPEELFDETNKIPNADALDGLNMEDWFLHVPGYAMRMVPLKEYRAAPGDNYPKRKPFDALRNRTAVKLLPHKAEGLNSSPEPLLGILRHDPPLALNRVSGEASRT